MPRHCGRSRRPRSEPRADALEAPAPTGVHRLTIVHERFTELGGAEQVVGVLAQLWPDAEVFTTVVDSSALPPGLDPSRVRPHPRLQRAWRRTGSYVPLLPLLPEALRRVPLEGVDVVVLSHHAFALHAANAAGSDTLVAAYVHTPARWIWDPAYRHWEGLGGLGSAALGAFAYTARPRERRAARRPDLLMANSRFVAERVSRWWGRSAQVVAPPVEVDEPASVPRPGGRRATAWDGEAPFVYAGRLVPYKRPELAVRAARLAGVRLCVVGEGRHRSAVEAAADDSVELVGRAPRSELLRRLRDARALVFPGIEDFGIVPVEAQALGTPVLAVGAGGVLDAVVPGRTGELVPPGSDDEVVEALAAAMAHFDRSRYDPAELRANAARFSRRAFARRVLRLLQATQEGTGS